MDAVLMSDTALQADRPIEPAGDGDAEPAAFDFDQAIDRHQAPLLRYARGLLGRRRAAEAEDIVQETFIRLHRQVTRHGRCSIDDLTVWLYRVAHNVAMDFGRRKAVRDRTKQGVAEQVQHETSNGPAPTLQATPLAGLIKTEALAAAMGEVEKLPDVLRQTVLLKIIEGMTMKQIAETMNTTPSNVHYRFHQALTTLAGRLKDHDVS